MKLLQFTPGGERKQYLLMDRVYSSKKMRETAAKLGYSPSAQTKLQ